MAVTEQRRLFAGRPLWLANRPTFDCRRLVESCRVDVAVVGAGITGAFLAHALAGRYEHVLVLDRRRPIGGSTVASTSLLQFEIDQPLIRLAEAIGWPSARRAWRRSHAATAALQALIRRERIACGHAPRRTLYLAGDVLGHRAMAAEAAARARAGIPGDVLSRSALLDGFGIDRTGAIVSAGSAVADPVRLAAGLLRRAIGRGVRFACPAEVDGIETGGGRVALQVGRHVVDCRHAIFCTGYEMLKGIPRRGMKVRATWAIASRPAAPRPSWLDRFLVWEASDPYLYLRSTPDGRVIVGGEDEEAGATSARRSIPAKSARLVRNAERLLPALDLKVSHRWTGPFGESTTGLPVIDRVPGMPGCHAVMGFGGNGITYAMVAAQVAPTLLEGRPDPDAALYRFDRRTHGR